jgi:hypothetical protein
MDPTKNTTQKTKEMSNMESQISPKTDDGLHGVTDPTKNTTQKAKEMSNTESRTPPKTQHRNLKR